MTTCPILMSASMVQATLREIENPGTGKTQTRRVLKMQPSDNLTYGGIITNLNSAVFLGQGNRATRGSTERVKLPYTNGDQLYVRETCRAFEFVKSGLDAVEYMADKSWKEINNTQKAGDLWGQMYHYRGAPKTKQKGHIVPSIHMPRWASRITLKVTNVRVERLQGISGEDVVAEGALSNMGAHCGNLVNCYGPDRCPTDEARSCNKHGCWGVREEFKDLWDSLNGKPRANGIDISWDANPWVVAVSFKPRLQNVDEA